MPIHIPSSTFRIPHRALSDLLFPPACLLCRSPLGDDARTIPLCQECRAAMPRCGPPVCLRCGAEIPGAFDVVALCARCHRHPSAFEAARAPWRYEGLGRQAIGAFKYHHHHRLGRWFAQTMAQAAAAWSLEDDAAVIPVPLHWLKRRLRGRSPTEELAKEVAMLLRLRYVPRALRRARWTPTQTRLRIAQRARNVRGAFTARRALVKGRNVLLVDDVLTSGATAQACARALMSAGAKQVFVLAAARTPVSSE